MSQSPRPDPLQCLDGTPVTDAATWRDKRRAEILQLFSREMYGITPLQRPQNLRFEVRETKTDARGGRATRLRVGVLFEGTNSGRQMELLVYLPNKARGKVPLFLGFNFDGNFSTSEEADLPLPTHWVNGLFSNLPDHRAHETQRGKDRAMWPIDTILERGYGIATASYGEVEPDVPGNWWHGPRVLAPPNGGESWGALGSWAWAMSRALDFLETDARIDSKRVALFGFSRLGKAALWAGAQDERFAMLISQNSGKGGVSLSQRLVGEPVAHLSGQKLGHWFAPNYAKYAGNEANLPFDGHLLATLVAPRPLLILSASEDAWSDPEGEFLGGKGASSVYELLGKSALKNLAWPAPQVLAGGTLSYYLRPGGHNVTPEDWRITLDFADKYLQIASAQR